MKDKIINDLMNYYCGKCDGASSGCWGCTVREDLINIINKHIPCNIGDKVYLIDYQYGEPLQRVKEDFIQQICISKNNIHIKARKNKNYNKTYKLNERAFLEKTDAENKLIK